MLLCLLYFSNIVKMGFSLASDSTIYDYLTTIEFSEMLLDFYLRGSHDQRLVRDLFTIGTSQNRQITSLNPKITSMNPQITFHTLQTAQTITILTKFHNFDQISQFWPNITILTKFHNFDQISQVQPNFTFSTIFHSSEQISQFLPNFTIFINFTLLTKFYNFY